MPIWAGFAALVYNLREIYKNQFVADAMKGKDWIWKV
jgi:hypothetical protein